MSDPKERFTVFSYKGARIFSDEWGVQGVTGRKQDSTSMYDVSFNGIISMSTVAV